MTKRVSIWWDDQAGATPGWVSRCTEYDERGQPILGRTAMDSAIEYYVQTTREARQMAADYWGVPADEVVMEEPDQN